jgi:hypothetical protein
MGKHLNYLVYYELVYYRFSVRWQVCALMWKLCELMFALLYFAGYMLQQISQAQAVSVRLVYCHTRYEGHYQATTY